jgi:prepilin-type N-terminal cleavage/methylation domain-containing protein
MSDTSPGFTLVEVLVALAITVLSMAVLFKVISGDLDRTRDARDQTAAESLAQSLLAQYTAAPHPGLVHGAAAGGYVWQVNTAPYADAPANLPVEAVTIAATVSWRNNGRVETRSLSTLRILPKALPQ